MEITTISQAVIGVSHLVDKELVATTEDQVMMMTMMTMMMTMTMVGEDIASLVAHLLAHHLAHHLVHLVDLHLDHHGDLDQVKEEEHLTLSDPS